MTLFQEEVIDKTIRFVKEVLSDSEHGHDWWHVERVWKTARLIARTESSDPFVVELGALLHDVADSKFHHGNEDLGPEMAKRHLLSLRVEEQVVIHVENIIRNISFKGGNLKVQFHSNELAVIQDADRLDALGAIGIARTFHYGGFRNRLIYDPAVPPNLSMTKEEYKNSDAPTLNHFYEKLLLLKDRMNTETGKKLALKRHQFMEKFLEQFYSEWEGSE